MRWFLALLAVLGWTAQLQLASPPNTAEAVYANRPNHIWDRVFDQFYVRAGWGGKQYGGDNLDPPLWPETKYLLAGSARQQALATLDEFLSAHAERFTSDPLKRAVFQHDLWAVFDWSHARNAQSEDRPLQKKIANIIGRLALSPEEIRSLPDTYAQAVASKAFPTQYDPANRDRGFLPPDLLQSNGPWVCLGRIGALAASIHANGRSVFLVFLRLPGGHEATLAYLNELRDFPKPTIPNHEKYYMVLRNAGGGLAFVPNPNLPEFPPGTEVALVRQMLVVSGQGAPTPTRITESVQIRVYRGVPSREVWKSGAFRDFQDVFEFRFSRRKLFAGEAGGLREITAEEKDFPPPMSISMPFDWLETKTRAVPQPVLRSCGTCHDAPGIHSLLTYSRGAWPLEDGSYLPRLYPSAPADDEEIATIEWKQQQANWRLLTQSMGEPQ
jgi:hypothetical protein